MSLLSTVTHWFKCRKTPTLRGHRHRNGCRYRPTFELLEDRTVPSAVVSGFNDILLTPNDDSSTQAISLVSGATAGEHAFAGPLNFFGESYSSVFVNNNGNLTFGSSRGTFTPFGLTAITGVPIIAPFFADVYTLGNSGPSGYGFGEVDGHNAFGATWDHVNFYSDLAGSKQNWFQVLLIDRSDTGPGNFDIEFNYNQIQWETGTASGGTNGLGGTSARVGFSNGSGAAGTFYELAGSGVHGAFLDTTTNGANNPSGLKFNSLIPPDADTSDNIAGRYIFEARAGAIITTPTVAVTDASTPFTGAPLAFPTNNVTVAGANGLIAANGVLSYTYNGSSTVPTTAGTYAIVVTFTPNDTTTFNTATGIATWTITPATPSLSASDDNQTFTASPLAFPDANVAVTGADGVLSYTYNGSGTAPTTAGTYAVVVTFTPFDTTDYNIATATASLTIGKATPSLAVTNASATYAGTAIAFSDNNAIITGPDGVLSYTYNESSTAPTTAGTYAVMVTFTPFDTTDYNIATASATLTIDKATPRLDVTNSSATYSGTAIVFPDDAVIVSGTNGVLNYTYNGSTTAPTIAGTYAVVVTFTPTDATDYNIATVSATLTIDKAKPIVSVADDSAQYTGSPLPYSASNVTIASATAVNGPDGTLSFAYNGSATPPTNAGVYSVTVTFTPTDATDFNVASASATWTIRRAAPGVSVHDAGGVYDSAAYDATATVDGLPGAVATLTYYQADAVLPAAPKDAGTYTVVASIAATDNNDSASDSTTFVITPLAITVTGITANAKTYDRSANATLNFDNAQLQNTLEGDAVTLDTSAYLAAFNNKDAGQGKTVTVTGLALGGEQAGDYVLAQPTGLTASIVRLGITVTGITAANKVYNHSTDATLDFSAAHLQGVLDGDSAALNAANASGAFLLTHVANQITVQVSGLTLDGNDAADYQLTQPTTTANITPATLNVTGVTAADKVFDGVTAATLGVSGIALVGAQGGDSIFLSAAGAGMFVTPNVGTAIPVQVAGVTVQGAAIDAGDYVLVQPNAAANITAALPTVMVADVGGTYDVAPFPATAAIVGLDGVPATSLEGTPLTIAYFAGTSTDGAPLADVPKSPGTFTAVASFAGSRDYAATSARVTFVIAQVSATVADTPDKETTSKLFAANEDGTIGTSDDAAEAAVFQPGAEGTPVVVTLVHFNDNAGPTGTDITTTSDGPLIERAKYDLKVVGSSSGLVVVATFAIPASSGDPTTPVLYFDVNPNDATLARIVPASMYRIVDGHFVVTFTANTPVTVFDLGGTVFTITDQADLASFALPLIFLTTPPSTNLANSNDILGDLLSTQQPAASGQLIGAVAPSNASSSAALGSSAAGDDTGDANDWMRMMDNLFRQLQRILAPQLHLFAEGLTVSMLSEPSLPPPSSEAAPDDDESIFISETLPQEQSELTAESPPLSDAMAVPVIVARHAIPIPPAERAGNEQRLWPFLVVTALVCCADWQASREKRQPRKLENTK